MCLTIVGLEFLPRPVQFSGGVGSTYVSATRLRGLWLCAENSHLRTHCFLWSTTTRKSEKQLYRSVSIFLWERGLEAVNGKS